MNNTEKELCKILDKVQVACGYLAEFPTNRFIGGCGDAISIMQVYCCVDCSVPFHRKCLLKHIKEDMESESLTKMPLEKAFKFIDQLK